MTILDFLHKIHVGARVNSLLDLLVVNCHLLFKCHFDSHTLGWYHSIFVVFARCDHIDWCLPLSNRLLNLPYKVIICIWQILV